MRNGDEASPSIILAGLALLVKMLITGSLVQNFFTYVFKHCPATSMQTVTRLHLKSFGGQAL